MDVAPGPATSDTATPPEPRSPRGGFEVHLENFSGPFDLLLSLITKHRLDITEVALGQVTDEFIAYIRAAERAPDGTLGWDLGTASEFLVVAATLLDLKAARLLPAGVVDDAEDLELLEARDLLFARLLQYRAYKQVAGIVAERLATEGRRFPRQVQLEPHLAAMLPELVWQIGPDQLAQLAARALEPKAPPPGVDLAHLHAPVVSVREQAQIVVEHLRRDGAATFRSLTAGAEPGVVVARFLALLELFRQALVGFEQVEALGELTVRWTGESDDGPGGSPAGADFEEFDGAEDPPGGVDVDDGPQHAPHDEKQDEADDR
ncbi:segregation and condensation protein A [Sediminihabitans luteus]|uniref:segregation and condensation protein A n=1 Tax=Sediminihabitans luteus TaxID=1138585 RepID=UPI001EF30917|nr:ScpA family protein [Sediminihabitans luteus]